MSELLIQPPLDTNAQIFRGVATVPAENMLVEPELQLTVEVPIEAHGSHEPRHRSTETLSLAERWRTSPVRRKIGALAAATTAFLAVGTLLDASPAAADEGGVYTVVDTQIGVYARNSPHTNDTERKDGLGAYDGDRIQEICGVTTGDPVGERNNHTWHKVKDLDRPDEGIFWISDHWLNTPNPRNELTPGEADCNASAISQPTVSDQPPKTPHYAGNCKTNVGQVLVESWNNALGSVYGDDGELKGALENYENNWGTNPGADDICVGAQLSEPDHANRRQYVSSVVSVAPDVLPAGCGSQMLIEVWGDGFYDKGYCSSPIEFKINKWLKSGTNVCAAISSAADLEYFKTPEDAANAVLDGKIKLGESDPERQITCITIKA